MWNLLNSAVNNAFRSDDFMGHGEPNPGNDEFWPSNNSRGGASFQRYYESYSSTFALRDDIEIGNKILLPSSALNVLARQDVAWPMLFELANTEKNTRTHCGVLEFSAEEGKCFLPHWLMRNLALNEGDLVRVTNVALPKGTFVKLQPVTSDFLDLSNHRAVLENSLRHYACVTVGDNINIHHNDKIYEVEILETKPNPAISVIETDLEVDFAPPKDYVEPERVPPKASPAEGTMAEEEAELAAEDESFKLFAGGGQRLDGRAEEREESESSVKKQAVGKSEPWLNAVPGGVHTYNETYARRKGTISKAHIFKGAGIRLDDL